jgi:hypothetical protein
LNAKNTFPLPHPFHVSKTDVVYVEKDKSIQITMHIFIDDLEKAFQQRGIENLRIGTDKESPMCSQFIAEYLKQKFKIKINTQFTDYQWIGKENSDDMTAVWCYFEIKNVTPLTRIEFVTELMTDVFSDQQNIISVVGPQQKKGYFLLSATKNYDGLWF